jgi:hypothetical protein
MNEMQIEGGFGHPFLLTPAEHLARLGRPPQPGTARLRESKLRTGMFRTSAGWSQLIFHLGRQFRFVDCKSVSKIAVSKSCEATEKTLFNIDCMSVFECFSFVPLTL